jgi:hypothetical protein
MSRQTVDLIQSKIASILDQNPDTSDLSSEEYTLRLTYMNMALNEWAEMYDWQALYTEYNTQTSTSTGNASIALPSDFRKIASFPVITYDGANSFTFPETKPQNATQYNSNDKRVVLTGNPQDGYNMTVIGTDLVSGASIKVPYFRSVQSLASPADIPEIPNPDYLVKKTVAYWWEARDDTRSGQAKQEAERILGNLIDYENVFSPASDSTTVKTVEETRFGNLRWGE